MAALRRGFVRLGRLALAARGGLGLAGVLVVLAFFFVAARSLRATSSEAVSAASRSGAVGVSAGSGVFVVLPSRFCSTIASSRSR